jgi:uncharacterized membrane protein YeaQ/YmgE (transglycosylase-associated protein family)
VADVRAGLAGQVASGCADRCATRRATTSERDVFSIIGFILLGIIAGYLGRLLMPGRQKMGFLATALLGMVGSLVGGTLGALLFGDGLELSAAGFIGSIIGVLIVLFVLTRTGRVDSGR